MGPQGRKLIVIFPAIAVVSIALVWLTLSRPEFIPATAPLELPPADSYQLDTQEAPPSESGEPSSRNETDSERQPSFRQSPERWPVITLKAPPPLAEHYEPNSTVVAFKPADDTQEPARTDRETPLASDSRSHGRVADRMPGERGQGRLPQQGAASKAAPHQARQHTVVDGDTLESLAEEYYGNASLWKIIYRANRAQLNSPELLPIGAGLTIPSPPAYQREHDVYEPPVQPLGRQEQTGE